MRRCEIHVEAGDESRTATRPCGRPATWWTDDMGPTTTWLCEQHQRELALEPYAFERDEAAELRLEKRRAFAEEYARGPEEDWSRGGVE